MIIDLSNLFTFVPKIFITNLKTENYVRQSIGFS